MANHKLAASVQSQCNYVYVQLRVCMCVCAHARVCACMYACVRVGGWEGAGPALTTSQAHKRPAKIPDVLIRYHRHFSRLSWAGRRGSGEGPTWPGRTCQSSENSEIRASLKRKRKRKAYAGSQTPSIIEGKGIRRCQHHAAPRQSNRLAVIAPDHVEPADPVVIAA